jgi:hypothetical protein
MAKMMCKCGNVFHFHDGREDYELSLLPWKFMLDSADALRKGEINESDFLSNCIAIGRDAHPCPKCGRIYIETESGSGEYDSYIKEAGPDS